MNTRISGLMLAILGALLFCVQPQSLAQIADNFNPAPDGVVNAIAPQADGKILLGGSFSKVCGQTHNNLGRVYANGTLDTRFNAETRGIVASVDCIAIQLDSKILVAGAFTNLCGQTRNRIGRLNFDGTLDTAFNPDIDGFVYSLAVQPNGKILVAGGFTTVCGQTLTNLARLNSDGTLDTSFNAQASGTLFAVAVQPDGKILVGGGFSTLGGQARGCLGRVNADGSLDTAFNPSIVAAVRALVVQPDGKIVAAGHAAIGLVKRFNVDGTSDTNFNATVSSSVSSMALQADGKILVGGDFTILAGQTRNHIGRLNGDGTLDAGFNPGATLFVRSLAVQADGKTLVGCGLGNTVGGKRRNGIARLNASDRAAQSLGFDDLTITWLRGGTSPEVWRTSFDGSTNGADWFSLGDGQRIMGGWQVTGVTVPINATIRARGFITGGEYSASSWFVESVYPQTAPTILVNDGDFGFRSNQFGFNSSGSAGASIVVEGSTNLSNWTALATNLLPSGPLYFSDPEATNLPNRFYRGRLE